jgi:hypothetical protein
MILLEKVQKRLSDGTALFSSSVGMMIKLDPTYVHTLKGVTATNSNSSIGVYTSDGKGTNKPWVHFMTGILKEDIHTWLPIKGSMTLILTE